MGGDSRGAECGRRLTLRPKFEKKSAVEVGSDLKARDCLLIACCLSGKAEFPAREPDHGVKEEKGLGTERDETQPCVFSANVSEFVGEDHPHFLRCAPRNCFGRDKDDGSQRADG